MAKDPAFLFYYQDFLVGTEFLTNEEVGIYIKILCHLADKDKLSEEHMQSICNGYVFSKELKSKFSIDKDGYYYNERLRKEVEKRRKYSESRRKNAKAYAKHMENEDEDENINIQENTLYKAFEKKVFNDWNDFCNKYPKLSKVRAITPERRKHLKNRFINKDFVKNWVVVLDKIPDSDFLMGNNARHWVVGFDFLIRNDENYHKILEGKYVNKKSIISKDIEAILGKA